MCEVWTKAESKILDEVKQEYAPNIIIGPKEEGSEGIWQNARDEADRRGWIKRGKIGQANSLLFKARDLVSLVEEIRRCGPF